MTAPTKEESVASLASVEEGIPAVNSDTNGIRARSGTVLSVTSKAYDLDGDGKLNEAEQAMRDLDKSNRGFLTNDKVSK